MTLIKYNPDKTYCLVSYPGYLVIDSNNFFGILVKPIKQLIYYNAMSQFNMTSNTFSNFGFAIETMIIFAQVLNVCMNKTIYSTPVQY